MLKDAQTMIGREVGGSDLLSGGNRLKELGRGGGLTRLQGPQDRIEALRAVALRGR